MSASLKVDLGTVTYTAVSYTHLDVYKRQVWYVPSWNAISARWDIKS